MATENDRKEKAMEQFPYFPPTSDICTALLIRGLASEYDCSSADINPIGSRIIGHFCEGLPHILVTCPWKKLKKIHLLRNWRLFVPIMSEVFVADAEELKSSSVPLCCVKFPCGDCKCWKGEGGEAISLCPSNICTSLLMRGLASNPPRKLFT
ncbi:uncharacterized protein LOC125470710 [Pyrus x bretschneideri]|uniref:uncharacterized protein LOC125470710 n=1 Tax=Pyrus x bretschneideri TaxID=225117 RepID=UPI00202FF9DB|nr:uncharacterized protein LOC125470710 [Pyrus x bretschneideri]